VDGGRITVKSHPGEWAVLEIGNGNYPGSGVRFQGNYTTWRDMEITTAQTDRFSATTASSPLDVTRTLFINEGSHNKFINLVIHDLINTCYTDEEGTGVVNYANNEAYGNLLYYCGWKGGSGEGHGHGAYLQNAPHATFKKTFKDNFSWANYNFGFQARGDNAEVNDFVIEGNVIVDSGAVLNHKEINMYVGPGELGVTDTNIEDNYMYYHDPNSTSGSGGNFIGQLNAFTLNRPGTGTIVDSNYFIGGLFPAQVEGFTELTFTNNVFWTHDSLYHLLLDAPAGTVPSTAYVWDNNTYYDTGRVQSMRYSINDVQQWNRSITVAPTWFSSLGIDANATWVSNADDRPNGTWKFLRINTYEAKRGMVVIYNWPLATTVDIGTEVTQVLTTGDSYEIRDAFCYLCGTVKTGTYTQDEAIVLNMTGLTTATPAGAVTQPAHPAPNFGVFIVRLATGAPSGVPAP
jgi:hypothetical protein